MRIIANQSQQSNPGNIDFNTLSEKLNNLYKEAVYSFSGNSLERLMTLLNNDSFTKNLGARSPESVARLIVCLNSIGNKASKNKEIQEACLNMVDQIVVALRNRDSLFIKSVKAECRKLAGPATQEWLDRKIEGFNLIKESGNITTEAPPFGTYRW